VFVLDMCEKCGVAVIAFAAGAFKLLLWCGPKGLAGGCFAVFHGSSAYLNIIIEAFSALIRQRKSPKNKWQGQDRRQYLLVA
jgi:hypothetical protein